MSDSLIDRNIGIIDATTNVFRRYEVIAPQARQAINARNNQQYLTMWACVPKERV